MMDLSGYVYVCSGGETFDSIALGIWGNERYAAELLCANPEMACQTVFLGGERLLIPQVDAYEDEAGETPERAPWRE